MIKTVWVGLADKFDCVTVITEGAVVSFVNAKEDCEVVNDGRWLVGVANLEDENVGVSVLVGVGNFCAAFAEVICGCCLISSRGGGADLRMPLDNPTILPCKCFGDMRLRSSISGGTHSLQAIKTKTKNSLRFCSNSSSSCPDLLFMAILTVHRWFTLTCGNCAHVSFQSKHF